ncbi:MAG: LAGLIDADG family homing endonuclease [Patescibacteria group bacterium]
MVNAVGKDISEVDRAYLAGFLDADGAIMATIEKHAEKKFGYRVRIQLKVTQKDKTTLEELRALCGIGRLRKNRTTYDWLIRDKSEALFLLDLISPYLRVKRSQAEIANTILCTVIDSREDLIKIARAADSLSRFNVRSKNRRKNFASMI